MMQLVEKHKVKNKEFMDICVKAKNLYNQSLYYWRQSIFGEIQYFTEYELTGLFAEFKDESYKSLPAQTSQQVIKTLFENIKNWKKSKKEYLKNPNKYQGKPKLPKYKKQTYICLFTNQQIRVKNGWIIFPEMANLPKIKTKQNNIQQVRIIPHINHCTVEVVYSISEPIKREYNGNWLGIDLGLNNLAACICHADSFIINGRPLKSMNHYYNKRKGSLQSKLNSGIFSSNRIERITEKRNNKINDYIHKASRVIVNSAIKNNVTQIIIGKNTNWKQNINIGKKNNRQFTSIPHATLIEKIIYKAQLEGIETVTIQESYTSKCSSVDLEPIQKHKEYAGVRVRRGLFMTSSKALINADVNGALNIARLGLKSALRNDIEISDRILSCVSQPKRLSVFNTKKHLK